MEVMSQQPRPERPFTERIDSKLTRFEMESRPHGQPCTVRFRSCSMNFVREDHYIGGDRTRTVERNDELELEVAHPVDGGLAVFRTESACHGAICRILMEVLPPLIQYHNGDRAEEGKYWDEFVPAGLVETVVAGAASGGWGSYACDVWMQVEVTRVYSEAEELLVLCEAAVVAPPSGSAPRAGDACPICMEELAAGGVPAGLPDCSHAFHRECILEWFRKAPTCPCCRRDMSHYLYLGRRPYMTAAAISAAERPELLWEIFGFARSEMEHLLAAVPVRLARDDAPDESDSISLL